MESKPKQCSALTNAVAHTALGWFRLKNSLFKKNTDNDEESIVYAERVSSDIYAPFVKTSFYQSCTFEHKDERPLDILVRSQSMAQVFREAVAMHGTKSCLGFRPILDHVEEQQDDGKIFKKMKLSGYKFHSYEDIEALVTLYGEGLRALGVEPRQNVVLLAETRLEWMCVAQALLRQNMPIVTLYNTLTDQGIIHGITETEATVVITTRETVERLKKDFANLEALKLIIYMEAMDGPRPMPIHGKTILSLFELRRVAETSQSIPKEIPPTPDDTAILMYTSGSTGVPKAVILTHRNILAAAQGLCEVFEKLKVRPEDDSYIAYLPLAHVFELNCEMIAILYGVKIGYSSAATLTDSSTGLATGVKGDCTLLKPTIMASVPLVLDRVKKSVLEKATAKSATARRVVELAVEDSVRRYKAGQDMSIYDKDVFDKIRSVVGGRIRMVATGSAPLSPETHDFIRAALGCHVIQGYGLTETCAAATSMEFTDTSTGSVGAPVNGAYIRLVDWVEGQYLVKDNKGEIIIGGDMIAAGYYKNPQLTEESFFEQGGIRWFRTGDIGEVTPQRTFKIIDRKKDLVKLQHGEYVSLGKVETELKTNQFVDNICVCGSGLQSYLVALVQVNEKNLKTLAREAGKNPDRPVSELCKDPAIKKVLLTNLQGQLQRREFQRVEIPKKLALCQEEWTPDSGLVTAAFKLRRKQIEQRFAEIVNEMYKSD